MGSHDSLMSNGEKVERILRSVGRKRSSTDMVDIGKRLSFNEIPESSHNRQQANDAAHQDVKNAINSRSSRH